MALNNNQDAARTWLDTERPGLAAVVAYTAADGWPAHAAEFSARLLHFLDGGHHINPSPSTHAHHAAQLIGDQTEQAQALLGLGTPAAGPLR